MSARRRPLRHALLALILVLLAVSATSAGVGAQEPDHASLGLTARLTPLTPGTSAIVRADGDCLRVRAEAGLGARLLNCIADSSIVLVLPLRTDQDGYSWQFISTGTETGWAADIYLAPYTPSTAGSSSGATSSGGAACPAGSTPNRGGLVGELPPSGVALALYGGGTLNALQISTESRGCHLSGVTANRPGGGMVTYIVGAPDWVNADWNTVFAEGRIPPGTPLMLRCASGGTAAIVSTPLPEPKAPAPTRTGTQAAPTLTAASAIVIDGDSGAVLFDKNGRTPLAPASLTKIATAILAVEGTTSTSAVRVDVDSRTMADSSLMGLLPGDCFVMRDLLYGLMLPSGNDAAVAIARYEAGSEAAFVREMNTLVKRLGLTSTTFTDPHGLGSPTHRSTAYDLAMLARYGMTLPLFREVAGTPARTVAGTRTLSLYNTNALLNRYPFADGVKTGFTEEAGRTLVASATRNGKRVFVTVLNAPDREGDAVALLDWTFANYRW